MKAVSIEGKAAWFRVARKSAFAILAAGAVVLAGCGQDASSPKGQPSGARPAVAVRIAKVVQKDVPLQITAIGTVQAYATVQVKSQVEGTLSTVHFKEGQDVKKGDLLFSIDPRSFEADLHREEADLARDEAQSHNAEVEAKRFENLQKTGSGTQEEYDQARTTAEAMRAAVKADKAAVESAKLELQYCSIHSPIDGRVGSLLVDAGNLIKANADNPMVVINQIHPIYVAFSVPEQDLPQVREYSSKGELTVEAYPTGEESAPPERGKLTFIDNTVDPSAGTIRLKGQFLNAKNRLWPGQFVHVVLTLTREPNTIVVPSQAIQTGQQGQYVYLVKPDQTADLQLVSIGRRLDGETVIKKGLKAGEVVVTDGQLRLNPGTKVAVKGTDGGGAKNQSLASAGVSGGTGQSVDPSSASGRAAGGKGDGS